MAKDDKKFLSYEEAVARLPKGKEIHTFMNPNGCMLVGADWSRAQILKALRKHEKTIEETGPMAMNMDHGLAFFDGERTVFVQTIPKQVGGS